MEEEVKYLDWEGLLLYHRNLEDKLATKANVSDLALVATTGNYSDLLNTPTNVSQFTNDAGYITSEIDNTNGHDFVEIGGIKWATMNIGATDVTEVGLYFQWGDVEGYTSLQISEGDKEFTWDDYKFNPSGDGSTFTKYNETDEKSVLDLEDDPAAILWGSDWRTPTAADLQALEESADIEWTNDYEGSGIAGIVCTDKEDSSKVLFFPAGGLCNQGTIISENEEGFYWAKSLSNTISSGTGFGFDNTDTNWSLNQPRCYGFFVRSVLNGPATRTIMGVTLAEKDIWNDKIDEEQLQEALDEYDVEQAYSAGDGLTLLNKVFSVDSTVVRAHGGGSGGSELIPEFDPVADTVHITPQRLTSAQKALARANIGVVTTSGSAKAICNTAANVATKEAILEGYELSEDIELIVTFTYGITSTNNTLNVNDTGDIPLYYRGSALNLAIPSGVSLLLVYDGTNFNVIGDLDTNTVYSAGDGIDITNYQIKVDSTVARFGEAEGSAIIPEFDVYNDTVHVTQQTLTAAQKDQIKQNLGITGDVCGVCSTEASTAAKTVTIPDYTLVAGSPILIKFVNDITSSSTTLSVNSQTAKPIYYKGVALQPNLVKAGSVVNFYYDGTYFNIIGDLDTNTTNTATTTSNGLMSSADKAKLNNIETGAQAHIAPTAAEVKSALGTGSGTSKYLREDGTWVTPPNDNTWRPLGTGANDACAGNDSRLSDARPASDVYSWAKASSKPSYTKSEVGLGNVDNTADSQKSVNYANSAGSAPANGGTATAANYLSTYAATSTDNSLITALKNKFNDIPKSVGTAVRIELGSHSMALGWFLNGYTLPNAYGGWFVSRYGTPTWVGVDNGSWCQYDFIHSGNIGSQSVNYANSAGAVAWTNVSSRPTNLDQFTNGPGYITGINKTMVVNALGYTPPTSDTNTWRPITNTYTGSSQDTSVSQYGTNALYNALVNGYASSAGNADTVDSQHFSYSNSDNNPTYLWGTNSNGTSFLAHRASMSVNYANSAGSAPASDVYSWAKASSKPSYSIGEISGITVLNGTMTTVSYNDGDGNGRWASYVSMTETEARKVISFQYMVTNQGGGFDGNAGCVFFNKNGWGYAKSYTSGTLSLSNCWFHLWGAGTPGTVYYNIIKRT